MKSVFFKDKNIVITGATKGIGRAIAEQLAEAGANIILVARNKSLLEQVQKELIQKYPDCRCGIHATDVSNYQQVRSCVKHIKRNMGEVFGLINNAGYSMPAYFSESKVEDFVGINAVKYLGSVYMTRELVDIIQEGGFISFTSSVVGYMGVFGYSSYAGPNFALIGLAQTLDQELNDRNISISVLCPPDTDTPGYEEENKTKPFETRELSKGAKLMSSEKVASIFLQKLRKKQFLITANFESALYYRLAGAAPGLTRRIFRFLIHSIQKKK